MRTKFQIMRDRRKSKDAKRMDDMRRTAAVLVGVRGLLAGREHYLGKSSIQNSSGLSSSGLGLGLMGCHSQPLAADCSAYNIKGPGGVQFQQHLSKAGVDADLHHPPVLSNVIPRAPKHWLSSVFELISVQLRKAKAYLAHCAKKALG